jgi:hypothetical protein
LAKNSRASFPGETFRVLKEIQQVSKVLSELREYEDKVL